MSVMVSVNVSDGSWLEFTLVRIARREELKRKKNLIGASCIAVSYRIVLITRRARLSLFLIGEELKRTDGGLLLSESVFEISACWNRWCIIEKICVVGVLLVGA